MTDDSQQSQLTLQDALKAHHQWKVRLQEALDRGEKLDVDTIKRDDCCALGKWLHGEGRRLYGARVEFVNLVEKHKEFHFVTGTVAGIINGKDFALAKAMLVSSNHFGRASIDVGIAINALKDAVR